MTSLTINGILFFTVCMSTLISMKTQFLSLGVACTAGLLLSFFKPLRKFRPALALGLIPFLFTGTLLINYLFSHSPVKEQYSYKLIRHYTYDREYKDDLLITLEGNSYSEFQGIRFFMKDAWRYIPLLPPLAVSLVRNKKTRTAAFMMARRALNQGIRRVRKVNSSE